MIDIFLCDKREENERERGGQSQANVCRECTPTYRRCAQRPQWRRNPCFFFSVRTLFLAPVTSIKTAALGIIAFNSSRLSDPPLFWSMAWKRPSTSLARFCARLAAGPVSTTSLSGFYRAGNHSEIIDDGAYLPATHGASGESFMQAWGKVSAHDASLGKSECSRRELGEK